VRVDTSRFSASTTAVLAFRRAAAPEPLSYSRTETSLPAVFLAGVTFHTPTWTSGALGTAVYADQIWERANSEDAAWFKKPAIQYNKGASCFNGSAQGDAAACQFGRAHKTHSHAGWSCTATSVSKFLPQGQLVSSV
jgi:hypothetical protein